MINLVPSCTMPPYYISLLICSEAFHVFNYLFSLIICSEAAEVCYPPCGCFSDDPPFDNPSFPLPESPDAQQLRYQLFTRNNPTDARIFTLSDAPDNVP